MTARELTPEREAELRSQWNTRDEQDDALIEALDGVAFLRAQVERLRGEQCRDALLLEIEGLKRALAGSREDAVRLVNEARAERDEDCAALRRSNLSRSEAKLESENARRELVEARGIMRWVAGQSDITECVESRNMARTFLARVTVAVHPKLDELTFVPVYGCPSPNIQWDGPKPVFARWGIWLTNVGTWRMNGGRRSVFAHETDAKTEAAKSENLEARLLPLDEPPGQPVCPRCERSYGSPHSVGCAMASVDDNGFGEGDE